MSQDRRITDRAPIDISVDFRRAGRTPFKVRLVDLSRTGCHVETVSKVPSGDHIWITLPGLAPLQGIVRWSNASGFGVQWEAPMHESIFDYFLQRHPSFRQ